MLRENENKIEFNKYVVFNFEKPKANYDYYINLANNNKIKDFDLIFSFPDDFDTSIQYMSETKIRYDLKIINRYNNFAPKGKLPIIDTDENVIAVPVLYALANDLEVGDEITISGKKIKILGFTDASNFEAFVTTPKVVKSLNLTPNLLRINTKENIKETERKQLYEEIIENTKPDNVFQDNKPYRETNEKLRPIITLLILLSILSLVFIYNHILNMRKKKYFIYRFNGMDSKQFYFMLLTEILFIYLISFILSLMIFYIYDGILMKQIFGILRYDLKLSSMTLVFVTYLIILIIAMSINIRIYFKKSLVESYKE